MITQGALRRIILFFTILLTGGNLYFPRFPLLFLALVACSLVPGFWVISRKMLSPALILQIIFIVLMFSTGVVEIATRFAFFFLALMLLNMYSKEGFNTLADDLLPLLKFMAVQSIATIALAIVAPWAFIHLGDLHRTILLIFTAHGEGVRPDGFFWEPGVYQFYLNIMLYLSLFVFESRKWIIMATLAVFATLSTTGIFIAAMLLGVYFWERLRSVRGFARAWILVAGCVLAVPLSVFVLFNASEKFTGESRGSFLMRQYDTLTGVNIALANPIFGIGLDQDSYIAAKKNLGFSFDTDDVYRSIALDSIGADRITTTNSIVYLFYSLGIPLGLLFMVGIFRQQFFKRRLLFGLLLCMTLMSEALVYLPFSLMLIFSGLIGLIRIPQSMRKQGEEDNKAMVATVRT